MQHGNRLALMTKAVAAACALAAMLLCGACAPVPSDGLPQTHVDGNGAVNVGHARCGACHLDAQRDELDRQS